jgi:hypothetical protein
METAKQYLLKQVLKSSNKGMSQQDDAVNIWMGGRRVNRIL